MKSQYGQKFNHDPLSWGYDENVKNENNPIREGYQNMLAWLGEKAKDSRVIVDLGCGTGNTILSFYSFEKVYAVDISKNMIAEATKKLSGSGNVVFIQNDLLGFFDDFGDKEVDTIVSTYALHHLTQLEKHQLFQKIYDFLPGWGKIIFGDLMFESGATESHMKAKYPSLSEDFDDEFYWCLEEEMEELERVGFTLEAQRFSDLSWGIYGKK